MPLGSGLLVLNTFSTTGIEGFISLLIDGESLPVANATPINTTPRQMNQREF
jgi:hypothetical protein